VVKDAWEIRQNPFREADELEKKLNFRRERIQWSLNRTRQELDDIDKLLARMRQRPEKEDGEEMPTILMNPKLPDWAREMWLLARRFISERETRSVRNMLVYAELRRTGVPEDERLRQFPPRAKFKGMPR
jgi:hypothetical protein